MRTTTEAHYLIPASTHGCTQLHHDGCSRIFPVALPRKHGLHRRHVESDRAVRSRMVRSVPALWLVIALVFIAPPAAQAASFFDIDWKSSAEFFTLFPVEVRSAARGLATACSL